MNKKEYFDFFKKHLPKDNCRDQFWEDLEEHFEDALYAGTLNKKTSESSVLKRMGDPNQTLLYYEHFMRKRSPFYPFLESFFWGLLSMPLYTTTVMANGITEQTEVLLYKAILWFVTATCLAGISYGFYRFAFSNLKPSNDLLSKKEKILSFLLNIFPAWIFTWILSVGFSIDDARIQDRYFPLVLGAYALVMNFFAWKAFVKSSKKAWVFRPLLNHLLFIAFLSLLLFPGLKEFILYVFSSSWVFLFAGNLKWSVWASGLLNMAISIFCFYSLINWFKHHNRSFPLVKAALLFVLPYAMFMPISEKAADSQELIWNKPALELTYDLEKEQMGSFYWWSERLRHFYYGEEAIDYEITYRGDGFFVHMHGFTNITFTPKSLNELNWQEVGGDPTEFIYGPNPVLHEDLRCELTERALRNHEGTEPPVLGSETECKAFYFKDELIFTQKEENTSMLMNAVFSFDQKWLLLEVQSYQEASIHDFIYLVQL